MFTRRRFALTALAAVAAPAVHAAPTSVPRYQVPRSMLPRIVDTPAGLAPNHIHVVPSEFALYLAGTNGRAVRYTVGVAKPHLYHPGTYTIRAKKEFPSWMPTRGMIQREPHLYRKYEGVGIPGGLDNPLGARALYLFKGNRDTFLRIHGTHYPHTVGNAVSNGCARLVNDQMVDLYDRTPLYMPVTLHRWA
ncbi:L,D-transpeptidase [Jannaschia aquimarina]|uniref:ErfK_2 protein n=1 Tax=Jannaschia aquimarina TaxID=935700 RepID=A0A0D1EEG1_9RHOB|nr:L,D-transpeptidase [Jannaschia aquimarina]KIT16099.1 putative L,D-transpeptidase ErfK/SrfK precursor [Jannaschia aquimarina]SNT02343.1 Lipoprotein-anchoring transpeptidase ErfK/SrfK [Jannaschia aquimarina]